MKRKDLKIYKRNELEILFLELVDRMEKNGKAFMENYEEENTGFNRNSPTAIILKQVAYSSASALLTEVNRIEKQVSLRNTNNEKDI